jgi:uncharacterized protein YggE
MDIKVDLAIVSIDITIYGDSVEKTKFQLEKISNDFTSHLKKLKIDNYSNNITISLNQEIMNYKHQTSKDSTYKLTNSFTITIDLDFSLIISLFDLVKDNMTFNIKYDSKNKELYQEELLQKCIKQAYKTALSIAYETKQELLEPIEINYSYNNQATPMLRQSYDTVSSEIDFKASDLTINQYINIIFALR